MQAWNATNTKTPIIAVCVPYKNWEPEWSDRVLTRLKHVPLDFANKLIFYSNAPSLPAARDALVIMALKGNADYIFFIDTDNVFETPEDPNEALSMLYQCMNKDSNSKDAKIVSGLYRAKQKVGFNYAAWLRANEKGYVPIQSWSGNWLEVSVVGMGCCLIDMKVFKDVPRPWFRWDTFEDSSEDFYFIERAKEHGYNVKVFTDVKLSHIGKLKVKCDGTIVTPDM
jgi:glycosyltransferase involved in cell wall biosynthesis